MTILGGDTGGTHVNIASSTGRGRVNRLSKPDPGAAEIAKAGKSALATWSFHVVSMGDPGPARRAWPAEEPSNLGHGRVGFGFEKKFGKRVRPVNDAVRRARGGRREHDGRRLFLAPRTGVGSALSIDGVVQPLELGPLYCVRGLEQFGRTEWQKDVANGVAQLRDAMSVDRGTSGGDKAQKFSRILQGARLIANAAAIRSAIRRWEVLRVTDSPVSGGAAAKLSGRAAAGRIPAQQSQWGRG